MKSFYSIIVTLGCLISSGSYAMAPRESEDIERNREETRQVLDDADRTLQAAHQTMDYADQIIARRAIEQETTRQVLARAERALESAHQAVEDSDRAIEAANRRRQEQEEYMLGLITGSQFDSSTVRSYLEEHPEINTQECLRFWLALAKGTQKARKAAKDKMDHAPSTTVPSTIAALGKGTALGLSFFIPGGKLIWILRATILFCGAVDDFDRITGNKRDVISHLHSNAEDLLRYFKSKATPVEWFDRENEHVREVRRLMKESKHWELQDHILRHSNQPGIPANIYKLQLLATTYDTLRRCRAHFEQDCALETIASSVGAAVAFPLIASYGKLAGIALNMDGNIAKLPTAIRAHFRANIELDDDNQSSTLLTNLARRIPYEEIQQAQQQLQREALQRRLAQVEQEREEAEIRLEEDRTALRPLIDEAVRAQLAVRFDSELRNAGTQS